jgi:hypothetical protein
MPGRSPRRRLRRALAGLGAALALAGAAGAGYALNTHHPSSGTHDTDMADRAAHVMPFDLDATTHTFTTDATGGVEVVVANRPNDQRNIALIRQHLRKEADRFAAGDFSDSATIHGTAMPGLRELQAGADRLHIRYQDVPAGARITYSSTDRVMVAALHSWFAAQNTDHSMPGMGGR